MPRRKAEAGYNLHVQIPVSLMLQLELLLHNPLREKRRYGVVTQIVVMALREWIERQQLISQQNQEENNVLTTLQEAVRPLTSNEPA